ncbi:MAG: ASKHA domain-containing protein [Lachnospiraceae bacterium]|nr:ASKHA domain-containing protein [Lachnospiraceae bacterium]
MMKNNTTDLKAEIKRPPFCTGRVNCGLCKSCILAESVRDAGILSGYPGDALIGEINNRLPSGSIFIADLGTTTIAGEFIENGRITFSGGIPNSQSIYGSDVVSRSEASINGHGKELKSLISKDISKLITQAKSRPERIILSGNTTIIHLLKGYDCSGLVSYPFTPVSNEWQNGDIDGIPYEAFPGISAYVGGDALSGLYALGYHINDKICLFIDLGTNGEMAIGNREKILVTSAAAGPAFEGSLIGTASDVISVTSSLHKEGIIDDNGLLADIYFEEGYPYVRRDSRRILITQKDIRNIQMAKSAVYTGCELLIKNYGINIGDIDKVYISGGMGNFTDMGAASDIGLIKKELAEKVLLMGNTSLMGLSRYVSNCEDRSTIDSLKNKCSELILANDPDFQDMYLDHMSFSSD